MKYLAAALLITTAPLLTYAEEDVKVTNLGAMNAPVKFLPIDRGNRPANVKQLRSDRNTMNGGFFRIDRSRTVATATPQVVTSSSPDTNAVRIIRGAGPSEPATTAAEPVATLTPRSTSNNPILSLFEGDRMEPSSFRDALTGSTGSNKLSAHQWPVDANARQKVSSNYGFRNDPFGKETKFHGGVDIAAPIGTPVLASANGRVESVGVEGGYGTTITLLHDDGSESRYSHLSAQRVTQGQYVTAGQNIGAVGSSGHSTGPHLDYRLSQDGVSIDPMKTLGEKKEVVIADTKSDPAQIVTRKLQQNAAKSERLIVVR